MTKTLPPLPKPNGDTWVLSGESNGRWSAGPDIDDVPASALDARALVALSWIASAPAEDAAVTQALEELRAVA